MSLEFASTILGSWFSVLKEKRKVSLKKLFPEAKIEALVLRDYFVSNTVKILFDNKFNIMSAQVIVISNEELAWACESQKPSKEHDDSLICEINKSIVMCVKNRWFMKKQCMLTQMVF